MHPGDEPPATSAASDRPAEGPAPAQYVTFLHGVGGSPLSWEEQVSKLPPQLPARAPWLRGMRPGSHEEFSLAAAAADIRLSLKLDGVNEGAIVGHSLGAMVALQCAIEDPESVSHLVLVAGQARPSASLLRTQRWLLRFTPARRLAAQGVSRSGSWRRCAPAISSRARARSMRSPARRSWSAAPGTPRMYRRVDTLPRACPGRGSSSSRSRSRRHARGDRRLQHPALRLPRIPARPALTRGRFSPPGGRTSISRCRRARERHTSSRPPRRDRTVGPQGRRAAESRTGRRGCP